MDRTRPSHAARKSRQRQLTLRYEAPSTPPETVGGVAIIRVGGNEEYFDVEVPWEG